MKTNTLKICLLALALAFVMPAFGQTDAGPNAPAHPPKAQKAHRKKSKGPGKEMASGGGDIGKGAAKGTADLGKGAAGTAGNLATGNVVGAGASAGKGAAGFGKNVAVGSGKGAAKIGKGVGGEFKKLDKKNKNKHIKENP